MKESKKSAGLLVVLSLVLIALIAYIAMELFSSGIIGKRSDKPKERVLHTSANGIETMDNGYMRKDLTAVELVKLMGNGINLGNTMEAYGRANYGAKGDVEKYETFWGQPVTTQEMISAMKASGLDTIRIPVAWTNAMDFKKQDYTIKEALFCA